ncbi:integrin alpha-M, partial [Eucyclogobius newberryi]|uniref:integrin alpha-M n=1 Tax=Eucyclogobius newberryi TaxID=166745 RepID=UPI003B5C3F1F
FFILAVSFSLAFNIDLRKPDVYDGNADDFFGFKVLQVGSKESKGIIVTAPLYMNGSGAVYLSRKQNGTSPLFTPKAVRVREKELPVKHFGLSIAKDLTRPQFTVCSPNVVTRCNENSYINSVCYNLTEQLQALSDFKPAFQDCTKKSVDLAFLFDGSTSMTQEEFEKNKDFIEDIMLSLKNTSIKFAAVQFSSRMRTVFTFNDYTNNVSSSMLKKEPQLKGLTNTHAALDFVLKHHLKNTSSGASDEATKVLVLITDGDPSDLDRTGTLNRYDSMNIIRFIIGVKEVNITKLREIASDPKESNTFHIENYNGLTGVLENFQKKIFQTEGITAVLAGGLTEEMSQTGFSAVYGKDALLLGSVGSQTWRGSLHELNGETETHIQDSTLEEDSYMGYSVSVGNKNKTALYFSGAPRYKHMGQVVLFTSTSGKWTPAHRINGEQHGSYFGAEVCSMDVDSDGNTDFLFVGAPLYYQSHRAAEGKIYIYRLTNKLKLKELFNITANVMGRFGTTIASVVDLNGDGLRDAAVGAPLENQNTGAVYLYLGDRSRGIRSTHSQRILGEKVHPGLQFFGQSIDGSFDAGNTGLPDLLVGSRGSAVVLKSKPVLNVTTCLTFEPHEINIDKIKCPSSMDDFIHLVTLKICFDMVEATKSSAEAVKPGLNISYSLDVDPMRLTFRGFFNSTTKRRRNLTETYELRERETCFNRSVYMPKCVTDTLSPIKININFSQVESESADAALNTDSHKEASVEVPFEKRCHNDTCIAEIEVDFDFVSPSLLVADHNQFNVSVTLLNRGEDSYNTSLTIYHPPGLSFSRMSLAQDSKTKPLYGCHGIEEGTACGVSLPVYRGQSQAKFMSVFHVLRDYEWKESFSMNITGHSDNQKSSKGSLVKAIPVQFEIKMTLLVGEDSITYMNFTTEEPAPKRLVTKYRVDNYGWRHFSANVTLVFPTKLEQNFEMNNFQVLVDQNITKCRESESESSSSSQNYCTPERECKYIVCDPFMLTTATVEFELSGEVQFKDLSAANVPFLKRYTGDYDEVEFESFLFVAYDKQKYSLDFYQHKRNSEDPDDNSYWKDIDPSMKSSKVPIELIVLPDKLLIIVTGAGGGLLFLILITFIMFKLGCFKRKLQDMIEEEEGADEAKEDKEDEDESVKELLEKQDITTDV